MNTTRHVLLLGSGLMAESVAKHILSRPEVAFFISRIMFMLPVILKNRQRSYKKNLELIDAPFQKSM